MKKAKDFDLGLVQSMLDRINGLGCTYASFQITSTGHSVIFNMYTPETGHHRFEEFDELLEHLNKITSEGKSSIRLVIANERVSMLRERIASAQEDLEREEAIIVEYSKDADGVPM